MAIRSNLLGWQWSIYPAAHRDRANLIIHIATAPLFWLGWASLVWFALDGGWIVLVAGLVLILVPILAQNVGHKREKQAPSPFLGFDDFVTRFFVEQTVTFPRFVLSGTWARHLTTGANS